MDESKRPSYYYNPYSLPYVAFLAETMLSDSNTSLALDERLTYQDIGIITNIDAARDIQSPEVSLSIHIIIGALLVCAVFFIQIRTLQMLKLEKSVNNRMMVTQAKIHMTYWPFMVVLSALTDNIYPLADLFSSEFCTFVSIFVYFGYISMILYSLYSALLRYACLVHTEKVDKLGKQKVITMAYWIFYLHTSIWTIYTFVTSPNPAIHPLVNQCHGWSDRVYLVESKYLTGNLVGNQVSRSAMVERLLCLTDSVDGKITFKYSTFRHHTITFRYWVFENIFLLLFLSQAVGII